MPTALTPNGFALLMMSPLRYVMSHDFFWGVVRIVRQTGTMAVIGMSRGNKGDPRYRQRGGGWLKGEGILGGYN